MNKTLRASVCFPSALHTAIKVAAATADPRVTLNDYVSRAVEASVSISDRAIEAAAATLYSESCRSIRSTVKFPPKVAYAANNRAIALDMSPSEFIAAVVAHTLSRNGQGK